MKITDFVKDKINTVVFTRYRAGHLYYKVERSGTREIYEFPVPVEDLQQATVHASMRAIELMRYIRQAINDGTLVHIGTLPEPWKCDRCEAEQTQNHPFILNGRQLCPRCSAEEIRAAR